MGAAITPTASVSTLDRHEAGHIARRRAHASRLDDRANSRFNIWVDGEDPLLADTAVSTTIRSTNGVPVIVERALWWSGSYGQRYEAQNSPGATAIGTRWALAEGEVGGTRGIDTYILLANTSPTAGDVKVAVPFEDGTGAERTFMVAGNSRFNVDVRSEFPVALDTRSAPHPTSHKVRGEP